MESPLDIPPPFPVSELLDRLCIAVDNPQTAKIAEVNICLSALSRLLLEYRRKEEYYEEYVHALLSGMAGFYKHLEDPGEEQRAIYESLRRSKEEMSEYLAPEPKTEIVPMTLPSWLTSALSAELDLHKDHAGGILADQSVEWLRSLREIPAENPAELLSRMQGIFGEEYLQIGYALQQLRGEGIISDEQERLADDEMGRLADE